MMFRTRDVSPFEPRAGERREFVWLVRKIQALLLELAELRRYEQRTPEIQAKERRLEQLRWRLAARRPTLGKRRTGRCRVTTAAASMSARTAGRLGSWLSVRHSLRVEVVLVPRRVVVAEVF